MIAMRFMSETRLDQDSSSVDGGKLRARRTIISGEKTPLLNARTRMERPYKPAVLLLIATAAVFGQAKDGSAPSSSTASQTESSATAQEKSAAAHETAGAPKPLGKKESQEAQKRKREELKRIRADRKRAQRAAEEAARHLSLPVSDITARCMTLANMALHRDVERIYQDVWRINWVDQAYFSVLGTATNSCGSEAQISVQARFYDRFGTEVSLAFINAIVPPNGSIPVRVVPAICTSGGQVGGDELCAFVIDRVRVWLVSSL